MQLLVGGLWGWGRVRNWRKDQPGPSSELVPNGGLVGGGVVVRRNNFDPRLCALDTTASPSQNQAIIAAFFFSCCE